MLLARLRASRPTEGDEEAARDFKQGWEAGHKAARPSPQGGGMSEERKRLNLPTAEGKAAAVGGAQTPYSAQVVYHHPPHGGPRGILRLRAARG